MAYASDRYMKKQGVKTVGFGYTDAYGELADDFIGRSRSSSAGLQVIAVERFARADTSVTAQALAGSANPDAMLVVAQFRGVAMPHKGHRRARLLWGKIYQDPCRGPARPGCAWAARTSKAPTCPPPGGDPRAVAG